MNLDAFIYQARQRVFGDRAYLTEPHFVSLYVRYSPRHGKMIGGKIYRDVLTVANAEVQANMRCKGVFTRFIQQTRIHYPELHLFLECVLERRLIPGMERLGFTQQAEGESVHLFWEASNGS